MMSTAKAPEVVGSYKIFDLATVYVHAHNSVDYAAMRAAQLAALNSLMTSLPFAQLPENIRENVAYLAETLGHELVELIRIIRDDVSREVRQ